MTDLYTDDLFQLLKETSTFSVSRLVLQPERFRRDDEKPMAGKGTGMSALSTVTRDSKRASRL